MPDSDNHAPATNTIGFLLISGFALLAYASAVEPLRAANRLSGRELYRWRHISSDGAPACASSGVTFPPDLTYRDEERLDAVIVCAGGNPATFDHALTFAWLRRQARRGVTLGGISGGPYILARANLLGGYRLTLHWEHAPAFVEDYPDLDLRRSLYEIDRDRLTSSGGTAPLDMMHALIARQHGPDLALAVSEWFLQTQVREGTDPQRMSARDRYRVSHPGLLAALDHMERQIENPPPRAVLAAEAGLSERQLERLFARHLGRTPSEHSCHLRLTRARDLLRQTSLSVLEVALACGFASASHFSRVYKRRFGHSPIAERRGSKK
jgi:transcriptional regulator GlxA family with amidase domain